MGRYKKTYSGRGNNRCSSYCNDWHRARYREWRELPWWRRIFTRHPQSRELFKWR